MSKNGNENVKLLKTCTSFQLFNTKTQWLFVRGPYNVLYLLLISKIRGLVGADPHRFPPFYSNGLDFSHKHIQTYSNNGRTFQVEILKMVWTDVSFSNFRALDSPSINRKPGKGNFRGSKSLEGCSLSPSFRKSVSIYPRSAPSKRLGGEMICYV